MADNMEDADFRVSRVVGFNSHLSALEFGFDLSNSKTIEQYIRSSEVHREFPGQVGVVRQVVDGKDLSDLHVSPMHTHAQNQLLSAYCWTTEGAFLSVTYGTSASDMMVLGQRWQHREFRTSNPWIPHDERLEQIRPSRYSAGRQHRGVQRQH